MGCGDLTSGGRGGGGATGVYFLGDSLMRKSFRSGSRLRNGSPSSGFFELPGQPIAEARLTGDSSWT